MLLASGQKITEHGAPKLVAQRHLPEILRSRLGKGGGITVLTK
ncbi:hypothetical protein A2U01_0117311, partial [Trifolium medium]|nr:hypothetical protein [Trifolium medium]